MNLISLTLTLGLLASPGRADAVEKPLAAPALRAPHPKGSESLLGQPGTAAPPRRERRPGIDGWMSQWYGALPSTCDGLPAVPADGPASLGPKTRLSSREFAPFARLAQEVCDAAAKTPAPDLSQSRAALAEPPAGRFEAFFGRRPAVQMYAEVKSLFAYEPPSWLVVHRVVATGAPSGSPVPSAQGARHDLEFWPADPRDLPGSPAHGAYLVLSQWQPAGRLTRGVAFKLQLDGTVDPLAWTIDVEGGSHAPLQRADIQRRLQEELDFWASLR